MTDEQKKFKAMILADLKLALVGGRLDDKYLRHIVSLWNGCNPETQHSGKMKHEGVEETGMFPTPFFVVKQYD